MVVGSGVPIVDATKQGAGVPKMGGPVSRFLCPWTLESTAQPRWDGSSGAAWELGWEELGLQLAVPLLASIVAMESR